MLLELTAPMMGGREALRRLRGLRGLDQTRYVAIAEGRADTHLPDFHVVVRKPFVQSELLGTNRWRVVGVGKVHVQLWRADLRHL